MFVTTLHDTVSKRKDEKQREKKQPRDFECILQEACADSERKEISYTTNGYTKDGTAYRCFEKRREYVH